jgi:ribonuclease J
MVSLTVYDGAMGIGGNKLYLEDKGKGVFLDFGKNFGKYGAFYEEFLKNRGLVTMPLSSALFFCYFQ